MSKFSSLVAILFCLSCGKKDDDKKSTILTADYSCLIGVGQTPDASVCVDYVKVPTASKSACEESCASGSGTFSASACADIAPGTKGCKNSEGSMTTTSWHKGEVFRTPGVSVSCQSGETEVTK